MSFHVGQKVVCVNAQNTSNCGAKELGEGAIYTVRWVGIYSSIYDSPSLCLKLVGIYRVDNWVSGNDDCPFSTSRFRPLTETKSEISFTHGADPSTDKLDNRRKVKVRA